MSDLPESYEFVKTLKDCGYQWVLVQEHTAERPETGCVALTDIIRKRHLKITSTTDGPEVCSDSCSFA